MNEDSDIYLYNGESRSRTTVPDSQSQPRFLTIYAESDKP